MAAFCTWFFLFSHFLSLFTQQILAKIKDIYFAFWSIKAMYLLETCGFSFRWFYLKSCVSAQAACRAQHVNNTQRADREMRLFKLFVVKGCYTSNVIPLDGCSFDCAEERLTVSGKQDQTSGRTGSEHNISATS